MPARAAAAGEPSAISRSGGHARDASGDAAGTAQRPQERVLALPLEPGEPDDLARVQLEVDLPRRRAAAGLRCARRTTSLERGRSGLGVAGVGEVLGAGHQPDELGRLDLAPGARRDGLAGPHHRDPVADLLDLVHPVRDEDRARPLAREPADDREQPVARRDVERRGRLVEDEDPRTRG